MMGWKYLKSEKPHKNQMCVIADKNGVMIFAKYTARDDEAGHSWEPSVSEKAWQPNFEAVYWQPTNITPPVSVGYEVTALYAFDGMVTDKRKYVDIVHAANVSEAVDMVTSVLVSHGHTVLNTITIPYKLLG